MKRLILAFTATLLSAQCTQQVDLPMRSLMKGMSSVRPNTPLRPPRPQQNSLSRYVSTQGSSVYKFLPLVQPRKLLPAAQGDLRADSYARDQEGNTGPWTASESKDYTITLRNPETGECTKMRKEHTGYVNIITFSPDDKIIVSESKDNTIKLWDAQTGERINTLGGHTYSVSGIRFFAQMIYRSVMGRDT